VLSARETYAVVLKNETEPIGSAGLLIGNKSSFTLPPNEGEIGYWIGVPYWGKGLIPEAVRELVRHGFEDLGLACLWCGYFDGNDKSRRVQEKCGFRYHHTKEEAYFPLIDAVKTEHITCMTRQQWQENKKG
jgi:ribosomal-protein-alanine N-acetyltransferase